MTSSFILILSSSTEDVVLISCACVITLKYRMKQIIQDLKTGETILTDVPLPQIGPGKVLSGLVKRISKEVKINSINDEIDIEELKI